MLETGLLVAILLLLGGGIFLIIRALRAKPTGKTEPDQALVLLQNQVPRPRLLPSCRISK